MNPSTVLIDIAFSRDGATLAVGAFDGIVRLWNARTDELLPDTIQAYKTGWALSVAFDPAGNLLATGGADGVIKLWDVSTRQPVGEPLVGHSNRVTDLSFSPDGKMLASSSGDSTIRTWNVADGLPADQPLTSGSEQVWTILPDPQDFDQLTALSGDGSVAWWNAAQDELLRPLLRTHLETEEMKGSVDGSTLYVASTGPLALVVRPELGDWEQVACEIANRSLTEDEWVQYMNGLPYYPACK